MSETDIVIRDRDLDKAVEKLGSKAIRLARRVVDDFPGSNGMIEDHREALIARVSIRIAEITTEALEASYTAYLAECGLMERMAIFDNAEES